MYDFYLREYSVKKKAVLYFFMRKLFTGEGGGWLALNFVTNIPLYHYGM